MLLVGLQCFSVSSSSIPQKQPTQGPQIPTSFTPPPPTSNSLDLCDSSQPPKPLSNTFNETLIGQVISTEKVFSDIQCIDFCLRSLSCKAYNMESRGSTIYCITLATIERRQEKYGSSCRVFDREKIEKFQSRVSLSCEQSPSLFSDYVVFCVFVLTGHIVLEELLKDIET
ncbi:unnamed protein product [Porites lobata]|uniref:Apple domain-containing protein n=1 Tax=Porites lobata TaxID=104759 RepID=A0ABN8QMH4_9CNID|nr:unnamed protein product [Porites lobata]